MGANNSNTDSTAPINYNNLKSTFRTNNHSKTKTITTAVTTTIPDPSQLIKIEDTQSLSLYLSSFQTMISSNQQFAIHLPFNSVLKHQHRLTIIQFLTQHSLVDYVYQLTIQLLDEDVEQEQEIIEIIGKQCRNIKILWIGNPYPLDSPMQNRLIQIIKSKNLIDFGIRLHLNQQKATQLFKQWLTSICSSNLEILGYGFMDTDWKIVKGNANIVQSINQILQE